MKNSFVRGCLFLLILAVAVSCGGKKGVPDGQAKGQYPGTEEGLKKLMGEFIADGGSNAEKLSNLLRPVAEDYAAVFEGDFAKKAAETYKEPWDKGLLTLKTKPGQTEINVLSVTSEDLKTKSEKSREFPGGWMEMAPNLKAGLTIYMVRFTEPGKERGMRFDGLIYVNGRWRIFPKPWRIK
ncbi:hypothetical protein KKD52_10010 [Myxococcota bacterium]|nr:hypothetical protein [Myxococcota bacterium]MBU1410482.1 hypothetical protein [Myxococcota bacterium]MBU1510682.1 hypothetical protein [Myxococcota bacterium]